MGRLLNNLLMKFRQNLGYLLLFLDLEFEEISFLVFKCLVYLFSWIFLSFIIIFLFVFIVFYFAEFGCSVVLFSFGSSVVSNVELGENEFIILNFQCYFKYQCLLR